MEPISKQIQNRTYSNNNSYSNGSLQSKPTIAIAISEQDELINWAGDLIASDYRLWFIKRLRAVGKERFVSAANSARKYDGESRQRVFAYLMKST